MKTVAENAKQITKTLSKTLQVGYRTKKTQGFIFDNAYYYAGKEGSNVPHSVKNAAYGVQYALQTSRANYLVNQTISTMSAYQLIKLIAEIAAQDMLVADVARYLNTKF